MDKKQEKKKVNVLVFGTNWKKEARESEAKNFESAAYDPVRDWGSDGIESARLYRERAYWLRRGPHSD